jgi:ATP-dependent DNA ligase
VRLVTRNGHDFSKRFPQVVAAVAAIVTVRAPAFPSDSEPIYLRR